MRFPYRLKLAANIILGRANVQNRSPARRVAVFPDDVFITSYPKSGNTWARFLIGNIVWANCARTDFFNLGERTADIYWHTDEYIKNMPRPRYIKSHETFDPRYPKIVYIVRDVRAVVVSYHDFEKRAGRISPATSIHEFIGPFLRGELNPFGTWKENVLSWIRLRGGDHERFCLVKFEDLKIKGNETLKKIAEFLRIECSEEQIGSALKNSSFNVMKKLEKDSFQKQSKVINHQDKADLPVVRDGKTNSWRDILDEKDMKRIEKDNLDLMLELGYKW